MQSTAGGSLGVDRRLHDGVVGLLVGGHHVLEGRPLGQGLPPHVARSARSVAHLRRRAHRAVHLGIQRVQHLVGRTRVGPSGFGSVEQNYWGAEGKLCNTRKDDTSHENDQVAGLTTLVNHLLTHTPENRQHETKLTFSDCSLATDTRLPPRSLMVVSSALMTQRGSGTIARPKLYAVEICVDEGHQN